MLHISERKLWHATKPYIHHRPPFSLVVSTCVSFRLEAALSTCETLWFFSNKNRGFPIKRRVYHVLPQRTTIIWSWVRLVCFSPPARWGLLDFIRVVLLLLLLRVLCLHFHVHCCLANSWPSSSPTSELSAHCWTSTWDLSSSVRTAGPQPGTFLAQRAPLDLNLVPS